MNKSKRNTMRQTTVYYGGERLHGLTARLPGVAHFLACLILFVTIVIEMSYHVGTFPRHELLEAFLIQPAGIVFNFVLAMKGRDWGNMSRFCLVMNRPFRLLAIFCAVTLVIDVYLGYIFLDALSQYLFLSMDDCFSRYSDYTGHVPPCQEDSMRGAAVRVYLSSSSVLFSLPACLFRIYDSCNFCIRINLGLDPGEPVICQQEYQDYPPNSAAEYYDAEKNCECDSLPNSDSTVRVQDGDDIIIISERYVGFEPNGVNNGTHRKSTRSGSRSENRRKSAHSVEKTNKHDNLDRKLSNSNDAKVDKEKTPTEEDKTNEKPDNV